MNQGDKDKALSQRATQIQNKCGQGFWNNQARSLLYLLPNYSHLVPLSIEQKFKIGQKKCDFLVFPAGTGVKCAWNSVRKTDMIVVRAIWVPGYTSQTRPKKQNIDSSRENVLTWCTVKFGKISSSCFNEQPNYPWAPNLLCFTITL